MHISRNGFVFNTAYAFMEKENRPTGSVSGCTLLWRFLWCGFWKVFFNLLSLFVLLPLIVLLWVIRVPILFLMGRQIYYSPSERKANTMTIDWELFKTIPGEFDPFRWKPITNWDLPKVFGFRLIPGVVLLALAFVAGEVSLVQHALTDWTSSNWAFKLLFMEVGVAIVILIVALSVLLTKRTRNGELGRLISANYRSFKERTCPVVEIVE